MEKHFDFPADATPITDCSGLIPLWIHSLKDLNRAEAENIMRAQRKYLQEPVKNPKNWFEIAILRTIHRAMFENVWEWAGKYRKSITSVGVMPSMIPLKLSELCIEVRAWMEHPVELTFLEMAARIHQRLAYIHPFENGNGRFSRLIADRFLLAFRCPYPIWPHHLNQEGKTRQDYIQTLKSADKGDYSSLIEFMKDLGAQDPSLEDLLANRFYKTFISSQKGPALVKALIRNGVHLNEKVFNNYQSFQLSSNLHLQEIIKILIEASVSLDNRDR